MHVLVNPAVKDVLDTGRPKGGLFMVFPNFMKNQVTDVSPRFWRIQAVTLKLKTATLLLINTYFPTDNLRQNEDHEDLQETLGHINNIIENTEFTSVLWGGDLNADFLRNTSHTRSVQDSVTDLSLTRAWDRFPIDFTRCQDRLGVTYTSTLDHFFWSENVEEAGVIHHPDNKSDHSPIYCVIDNDRAELHRSHGVTTSTILAASNSSKSR